MSSDSKELAALKGEMCFYSFAVLINNRSAYMPSSGSQTDFSQTEQEVVLKGIVRSAAPAMNLPSAKLRLFDPAGQQFTV